MWVGGGILNGAFRKDDVGNRPFSPPVHEAFRFTLDINKGDKVLALATPSMASDQFRRLEEIDELDFSMMKMKLCLPEDQEGKGWSQEKADRVEKLYRMFLKLHILCPNVVIIPTQDIDDMWHGHILDTKKYHRECDSIFGHYLHHFPYLGLRGEQDARNLQELFDKTVELFRKHFDENPQMVDCSGCTTCGSGNGYCGHD